MSRLSLTVCGLLLLVFLAVGVPWLGTALAQPPPRAPLLLEELDPKVAQEALKLQKEREKKWWEGTQMVVDQEDVYILKGPYLFRLKRQLEVVSVVDLREHVAQEDALPIEIRRPPM